MILVTGATGNVGRQVVGLAPGKVRALSRTGGVFPGGVDVVRGDLARPETLIPALDGVDAVFLMWPPHTGAALPEVLDILKTRVPRVVFLGSGGVADLTMDEQEALVTGAGFTMIRPSTFAANALWWVRQIHAGDVVRGIHGELGMAMLHETDIALVAVRALTGPAPRVLRLTGPEVLSQAQQVEIIGSVLGRPLRWEEVSRAQARRQLLADDFPPSFVDVLLDAYAAMSTWPAPEVTTTVEDVTGVPARTFRQWVADHVADFAA